MADPKSDDLSPAGDGPVRKRSTRKLSSGGDKWWIDNLSNSSEQLSPRDDTLSPILHEQWPSVVGDNFWLKTKSSALKRQSLDVVKKKSAADIRHEKGDYEALPTDATGIVDGSGRDVNSANSVNQSRNPIEATKLSSNVSPSSSLASQVYGYAVSMFSRRPSDQNDIIAQLQTTSSPIKPTSLSPDMSSPMDNASKKSQGDVEALSEIIQRTPSTPTSTASKDTRAGSGSSQQGGKHTPSALSSLFPTEITSENQPLKSGYVTETVQRSESANTSGFALIPPSQLRGPVGSYGGGGYGAVAQSATFNPQGESETSKKPPTVPRSRRNSPGTFAPGVLDAMSPQGAFTASSLMSMSLDAPSPGRLNLLQRDSSMSRFANFTNVEDVAIVTEVSTEGKPVGLMHVTPSYGSIASDMEDTAFSEATKCTVWETTVNLISLISGSGMLSLPFAAASMGWSAVGLLAILAVVFMYSFGLVAEVVEARATALKHAGQTCSLTDVDYVSLGRAALGPYGAIFVLSILTVEMFLALVTFLINIGLNVAVINPSVPVAWGILGAATISMSLSFLKLKQMSYSSSLGVALTSLVLFALLASGAQQPVGDAVLRQYKTFNKSGVPLAFGLIAFCFGGHGAFPKMYASMKFRKQYPAVLLCSGGIIFITYALMMIAGYYIYAQFSIAPVSRNIGTSLTGIDLPQGTALRVIAALGIIANLQVTCPLVTYPIRDMLMQLLRVCDIGEEERGDGGGRKLRRLSHYNDLRRARTPDHTPSPEERHRANSLARSQDFECDEENWSSTTSMAAMAANNAANRSLHYALNKGKDRMCTRAVVRTVSTVAISILAMILALALQSKFAAVCGFVGSVATTITSLILPLLFFYTLRKRSAKKCGGSVTTTLRSILNLCILFVALGSIVVGAGGSLCNIWEIRSGVCVYIVPH